MNIHHLELFYYVTRHGGISRAVRHIPYGIQQPAVSSQMLLLEEDLGTRLFDRSPFRLTEEGGKLFAFVRPFFENLDAVATRLRKQAVPLLRIGTSELVLREYLPAVMQLLHQKHPSAQQIPHRPQVNPLQYRSQRQPLREIPHQSSSRNPKVTNRPPGSRWIGRSPAIR